MRRLMERPERPDEDADADEIAKWMAADFDRAVTEGIAAAGADRDEHEDDSES